MCRSSCTPARRAALQLAALCPAGQSRARLLSARLLSAVKYHLRGRSLAVFLATSSYKCNLGRAPCICNFTKKPRPGPLWRVACAEKLPRPGSPPELRALINTDNPLGDPGPLSCFHAASCVMTRLQQIAINRTLYQAYNSKKCEPMIDPRAPLLQKMSLAIHPRPLRGC